MVSVRIIINDKLIDRIKNFYGKGDYNTIETIAFDVMNRYLDTAYFEPKLVIKDSNYLKCQRCGETSKTYSMIDLDGKNLGEYLVCKNCYSGMPELL